MYGYNPLVLMRGMVEVPVGNVQEQLHYLGFPLGMVDNIFGPETEVAVRQFQANVCLPETGIVDAETWFRMFCGQPLPAEVLLPVMPCEAESQDVEAAQALEIRVNLALRRLTLIRAGAVAATYPVAVGKPSTPTPLGRWTILNKAVNPGGAFGTRWMGFTNRGHGIHGTNQPASIGQAVSNGCVRMQNADVERLFPLIPVGTPVVIEAGVVQPAPAPGTYVVRPGDTLWLIAQRFGTTVEAIRAANRLVTDVIIAGQVLIIPGATVTPPPAPPITIREYVVQPGDSLFTIAQRFGTTVAAIVDLNRLTTTQIFPGQRLRIPATS